MFMRFRQRPIPLPVANPRRLKRVLLKPCACVVEWCLALARSGVLPRGPTSLARQPAPGKTDRFRSMARTDREAGTRRTRLERDRSRAALALGRRASSFASGAAVTLTAAAPSGHRPHRRHAPPAPGRAPHRREPAPASRASYAPACVPGPHACAPRLDEREDPRSSIPKGGAAGAPRRAAGDVTLADLRGPGRGARDADARDRADDAPSASTRPLVRPAPPGTTARNRLCRQDISSASPKGALTSLTRNGTSRSPRVNVHIRFARSAPQRACPRRVPLASGGGHPCLPSEPPIASILVQSFPPSPSRRATTGVLPSP